MSEIHHAATNDPSHQPAPHNPAPHSPAPHSPAPHDAAAHDRARQDPADRRPAIGPFASDPHEDAAMRVVARVSSHLQAHHLLELPTHLEEEPDTGLVLVVTREEGSGFLGSPEVITPAAIREAVDDLEEMFTGVPAALDLIAFTGPDTVEALDEAAARPGLDLGEVVRIEGGRWWSLTCPFPGYCCPAAGRLVQPDPAEVDQTPSPSGEPVTADSADDGLDAAPARANEPSAPSSPVAPSRSGITGEKELEHQGEIAISLLHLLLFPTPSESLGYRGLVDLLEQELTRPGGARESLAADAERTARLLAALIEPAVPVAFMTRHDDAALDLWQYLVEAAPYGAVAPAATLLASANYQRGRVSAARRALRVALADDPENVWAQILDRVVQAQMPVEWFTESLNELVHGVDPTTDAASGPTGRPSRPSDADEGRQAGTRPR